METSNLLENKISSGEEPTTETDTLELYSEEEFLEKLNQGQAFITSEMIETLINETKKSGIVTLDYKIEGTETRVFRGKISVYLTRSWIDDSLPIKTTKWLRLPVKRFSTKRRRVMEIESRKIEQVPVSYRKRLLSMHNASVPGVYNEQEWKDLLARFSAVFTILNQILDELQIDKKLEYGTDRFNQVRESFGIAENENEESILSGSTETSGEVGEDGNIEADSE